MHNRFHNKQQSEEPNCEPRVVSKYFLRTVESMHNMELIYAPKRKHFRKTYDARIHLALLDWDENIDREMIETDGPEGGKPGKCKPPKTFAFQHKVAAEVHGPKYWL